MFLNTFHGEIKVRDLYKQIYAIIKNKHEIYFSKNSNSQVNISFELTRNISV